MATYDVFISYAREDEASARRLWADLAKNHVKAFFDREDLLGGDRWKTVLRNAIRDSEYFIALLSSASVQKRGHVQKELREALEEQSKRPESENYIVPVRLENCKPSHPALEDINWIDIFPDYDSGFARIIKSLQRRVSVELEQLAVDRPSPPPPRPAPRVTANISRDSLQYALEFQPMVVKEAVTSKLALLSAASAAARYAVRNLYDEPNLSESAWQRLIEQVELSPSDPQHVRDAVTRTFRSQILTGPSAMIPASRELGALLPMDALAQYLVDSGHARTIMQARRFARRLLDRDQSVVIEAWKEVPLGRHVMWATFDPEGGPPFADEWSANDLLCMLGRGRHLAGDLILTFEYTLPQEIVAHVPTVADAYASAVWDYRFRPGDAHQGYGWSVPWDDCAHLPLRAEVVHAPVTLATMDRIRVR